MPAVLPASPLLEIVNDDLGPKRLAFLDKLQMHRMILIFILSLFRLELDVQRDLVSLIHHCAMAGYHFASVKLNNARNVCEVFLCPSEHFIRRGRDGRVSPKNNDMGKHLPLYEGFREEVQPGNRLKLTLFYQDSGASPQKSLESGSDELIAG
jgi:hypothetical protein